MRRERGREREGERGREGGEGGRRGVNKCSSLSAVSTRTINPRLWESMIIISE